MVICGSSRRALENYSRGPLVIDVEVPTAQ